MVRKIIKINEDACNGCGLCANACHEGAIAMINGKAKLIRDDYCDGLGDCLPACPTNAITFEEREATPYDEAAVQKHLSDGKQAKTAASMQDSFQDNKTVDNTESQLHQWPIQIKLISPQAPCLQNANLLIAADCTAYAYNNFHHTFMKNHVTLIGCPKLDEGDYSKKLTEILKMNDIQKVTVVRMEVPCCSGIANATIKALKNCGKMIPWQVVTISTKGQILGD